MRKLFFLIMVTLLSLSANAASIGEWNMFMSYYDITQVVPNGKKVYVLASGSLYNYNTQDKSVTTYDKVRQLNGSAITIIRWCSAAKCLIIIYSDGNIDFLYDDDSVINLSDYKSKLIAYDKTIYGVDVIGSIAYLSTGFGVVKVDVQKQVINETYTLGFKVNYVYQESGYLYAASETDGVYRGLMTENLIDFTNWQHVGEYVARTEDLTNVYDEKNGCWWTGDGQGSLTAYKMEDSEKTTIVSAITPGGPKYNWMGRLLFYKGKLYTSSGGGSSIPRPGCVQVWDGTDWQIYEDDLTERANALYANVYSIDVDPRDENHLMAGTQSGIFEFQNGKYVQNHNNDNSPLQTASTVGKNNRNYVLVCGLKYDSAGNLWVLNSSAPRTNFVTYTTEGEWVNHSKKELMFYENRSMEYLRSIMFDSRGLMWFVNDHFRGPALACYKTSTDELKTYRQFVNQDGTEISLQYVRHVAEDKDHNIWVATHGGPLLLTAEDVSTGSEIFTQVKVPRNDGTNYADYLLSGVDVNCIAVDGGNRKWFATNGNGVYLISADNMEEIYHFTSENSPLLSNYVDAVEIDNRTGEVFFGTPSGLCSFMSDASATNEDMNKDNVYAYPNPVPPGYTGLITITGLSYNADVKIVTVNGTLVREGRSNGGTFTWDGCDGKGRRVASGVYMVETATSSGGKGTVCKVAVVN